MKTNFETIFNSLPPGTATNSALAEIFRRCDVRLAEAIRPGVLAPIENHSHANGRAASAAVIAEIRAQSSSCAR